MSIPLTHVIFVLDASGSMDEECKPGMRKDVAACKAFNSMLDSLAEIKGSLVRVSVASFDDSIYWKGVDQDVHEPTKLYRGKNFSTGGGTHLRSAMFNAITKADSLVAQTPGKVLLVFVTDGADSFSPTRLNDEGNQGVSPNDIKALVSARRKAGYGFRVIGLNQAGYEQNYLDFWNVQMPAYGIDLKNEFISGTDMIALGNQVTDQASRFIRTQTKGA